MAEQESTKRRSFKPLEWLKSPSTAIYITYFMSTWGDSMWHFVIGLYLVILDNGVLRLAAVYGFTKGLCVLFLGGIIGHWVDVNPRLKVVRLSLFIQNLSVAVSAVGIAFMLVYRDHFYSDSSHAYHRHLLEAVVMLLAIIADLASIAYRVSIEKDWIVVVAAGDKGHLASLNATSRTISLVSKALSPMLVAQVMTFGSRLMGALIIAVWNVVSVGIEYLLLMRVYKLVPRLRYKEAKIEGPTEDNGPVNEKNSDGHERNVKVRRDEEGDDRTSTQNHLLDNDSVSKPDEVIDDEMTMEERKAVNETDALSPSENKPVTPEKKTPRWKKHMRLIMGPFIRLLDGWSLYVKHRVFFAGLGLGFLYMTVVGFDSITVGYIYAQGVSESILGVCTCMAAMTGIMGTFIFTRLRKTLGLNNTGIFGFSFEVLWISLAVVSVWTPGSPFRNEKFTDTNCSVFSETNHSLPVLLNITWTDDRDRDRDRRSVPQLVLFSSPDLSKLNVPLTLQGVSEVSSKRTARAVQNINVNTSDTFIPYQVVGSEVESPLDAPEGDCAKNEVPKASVILFLIGIVASRIGLWIADLSVTQTFQENVEECERGTLGGIQDSVNMLLDTIKFILVIILPHIHTFGILIILSFCFIVLGEVFFILYTCRERGCCSSLRPAKNHRDADVNIIYKPKDSNLSSTKV